MKHTSDRRSQGLKGAYIKFNYCKYYFLHCLLQEIRRRYPSHEGCYRDCLSTIDAITEYHVDEENVDEENIDEENMDDTDNN